MRNELTIRINAVYYVCAIIYVCHYANYKDVNFNPRLQLILGYKRISLLVGKIEF